jgi:hypothetical protein
MKTSLVIVLVCAGMLFMACAGVAWAQGGGYVCYDQHQVCGTYGGAACYTLYYGQCPSGQICQSSKTTSQILGGCIADPSSTCFNSGPYYCYTYLYSNQSCSGGFSCMLQSQYSGC